MGTTREQNQLEQASRDRGSWQGSTEIELLRCLARASLGPAERARLAVLLDQPIAWQDFIRMARRHRLLPLSTRHLLRLAPGAVPAARLTEMREYMQRNALRSLQLTAELCALLRTLSDAGIAAIPYKGPVLAQQIYGSLALRDVLDLDLLVAKRDVLKARELLARRGYRPVFPSDRRWDAYVLRSGCNFPLVQDATGVIVELHWTPETCITDQVLTAFWERLESVPLAELQARTFARADLILLLCLHGCRHMWERLEWVAGVAELLRLDDFSWADLLQLASSVRARRALFVGVLLAHEQLGAPVPPVVLHQARADRRTLQLVDASYGQLFSDTLVLAHRLGLPFHTYQLRSREGWADRLRYIGRRMVAPSREDRAAVHLPWHLLRLYSATRPLRLVAAHAVRSFRSSTPSSPRWWGN